MEFPAAIFHFSRNLTDVSNVKKVFAACSEFLMHPGCKQQLQLLCPVLQLSLVLYLLVNDAEIPEQLESNNKQTLLQKLLCI